MGKIRFSTPRCLEAPEFGQYPPLYLRGGTVGPNAARTGGRGNTAATESGPAHERPGAPGAREQRLPAPLRRWSRSALLLFFCLGILAFPSLRRARGRPLGRRRRIFGALGCRWAAEERGADDHAEADHECAIVHGAEPSTAGWFLQSPFRRPGLRARSVKSGQCRRISPIFDALRDDSRLPIVRRRSTLRAHAQAPPRTRNRPRRRRG